MRLIVNPKLEAGRVQEGPYRTAWRSGLMGAFNIIGPKGADMRILSSGPNPDPPGWEHVSVSLRHRPPNWAEMCWVKNLFWGEDECVVQYHPPAAAYVNCHPFCLHLWRPTDGKLPMPPPELVGPLLFKPEKQRA